MSTNTQSAQLSASEEALKERLRIFARGNHLRCGDEEAAALLIDRLQISLATERDRANQAEAALEDAWEDARKNLTQAVRNEIKNQLVQPDKAAGTLSSMALVKNPYRNDS